MSGLGAQAGVGKVAEGADAVVEGDDDHALVRQVGTVVHRLRGPHGGVAPTVDPHEDRAARTRTGLTRPDVEVQAVLAQRGHLVGGHARDGLRACRTPGVRLADALPGRCGARRAPAVLPGGGGGVGDSLVDGDAVECGLNTGHQAGLRTHRPPGVAADGAGSSRGGVGFHTAQERCSRLRHRRYGRGNRGGRAPGRQRGSGKGRFVNSQGLPIEGGGPFSCATGGPFTCRTGEPSADTSDRLSADTSDRPSADTANRPFADTTDRLFAGQGPVRGPPANQSPHAVPGLGERQVARW